MTAINLLPQKSRFNWRYFRAAQRWRQYLLILLVVFLILGSIVFALKLFLYHQLRQRQRQKVALQQQLNTFQGRLQQQIVARQKIHTAAIILKKRRAFSQYLALLKSFLGQGADLREIHAHSNQLLINGSWPGLTNLAEFEKHLAKFRHWFPKQKFQLLKIENLSAAQGGVNFSLLVKLEKK